jgi:hypothetical protein
LLAGTLLVASLPHVRRLETALPDYPAQREAEGRI